MYHQEIALLQQRISSSTTTPTSNRIENSDDESNLPDRVTRLETIAEVTLLAVQQLGIQQREMQKTLTDSIQDLLGMMNEQRGDIAEMQSKIRGLQRENRHILDILLNRQNLNV
ncbi:hypothetical protein H6F93_23725 [Leptolyngbya sp. FACHB-671]|uniref:hypothetical protein n=1 Tax=Leptolyngbya sp. FACHB-671 TaxID=2692812 RepID=UPI001687A958|nr:hypothetical protein [Leptolyngbya sp. FACHB-671]MBD1866496.1 hypothetical protein [Cyanobacteria bacterium FACHB-471]MBD2070484.1 hypothetical protein [Leptolyngbya sp. FACHB-671]